MKHTCPNCGHKFEQAAANQQAGGKARWKGTKKKDRSSAARVAALARWERKRKSARCITSAAGAPTTKTKP